MIIKNVKRTYGDGTTESRILLTAAEGKALTNDGETLFNCVETTSSDGWTEVDAPATDEPISDTEALEIITGGTA
jgi:hypothetical protein